MKLKHLRGNIYAIKGKAVTVTFNTPGLTANSLFIDDRKKAVIDPASNRETLENIEKECGVDYCFLSHAHLDHICSLNCFPKAEVFIHRNENATLDGIAYNLLYSRHFMFCFLELWKNRLLTFKVHHRFEDGDTYDIGNTRMQVIHAPGHTGGHCFFYFPNERILYSGDFDLSAMGPSYSYVDSSIEDMLRTTRKIRNIPVDIWVSGHWRYVVTDDIGRKIDRFAEKIGQRDDKILSYLQTAKSEKSMVGKDIVLPSAIVRSSWLMQAMEKKMLAVHLKQLEQQGELRRLGNGQWLRTA